MRENEWRSEQARLEQALDAAQRAYAVIDRHIGRKITTAREQGVAPSLTLHELDSWDSARERWSELARQMTKHWLQRVLR